MVGNNWSTVPNKDEPALVKTDSLDRCKPGPRNGGGGPQTMSFVERVCKKENYLIILLKDRREDTQE